MSYIVESQLNSKQEAFLNTFTDQEMVGYIPSSSQSAADMCKIRSCHWIGSTIVLAGHRTPDVASAIGDGIRTRDFRGHPL